MDENKTSKTKNSFNDLVNAIYYDEEVEEARVTKEDIKIVLRAFKRQMLKMLKKNGSFNFWGFFKIRVSESGGWTAKNIKGEEVEIKKFNRVYFSLSKKSKEFLNSNN